ncbi:hypothetical protein BGZ88_000206 [Linnemannia elongata]|nr:hypothetical protein BGZ88_000206 [Linnemannia elongata]
MAGRSIGGPVRNNTPAARAMRVRRNKGPSHITYSVKYEKGNCSWVREPSRFFYNSQRFECSKPARNAKQHPQYRQQQYSQYNCFQLKPQHLRSGH